ncbi:kelch repeat-containing protein [Escherichia coli]|uniref:kelch repeat-containing protein n=1 Tax=Escherichia coli TaxID=562 RepID=UPI003EBCB767
MIDGKIYVFGGIGKDKSGVITLQKDVYSYDIAKDKWEKLMTRPLYLLPVMFLLSIMVMRYLLVV